MDEDLLRRQTELVGLTHEDPDPRVRHRAHVLVAVLASPTKIAVAQRLAVSVKQIGRWRQRYLAEGAAGLRDRDRPGRPVKLDADAQRLLTTVIEQSPMDHGYPVTTWTIADLTDRLARKGWPVANTTVFRMLHRLGYRHRRPRHALRHRQDTEAVASATHTLAVLQKKGRITRAESASCILMSANFIPTPTWPRCGVAEESPSGSPRPEPING